MPRYVAFLGSINVGGNQLRMADLRTALEEDGFENVSTVVASGNVMFDHATAADASLEKRIAAIVAERFDIETFAAVRSKAELAETLEENPFAGDGEEKFVHTVFLDGQPAESDFAKLAKDHEGRGREQLAPGTRALHDGMLVGEGASYLSMASAAAS
jgi:uncharacterized protein (DUF1697 family)